jgi:hypothetical protein
MPLGKIPDGRPVFKSWFHAGIGPPAVFGLAISGKSISWHSAMNIREIFEQLPKLSAKERQEVRDWLA